MKFPTNRTKTVLLTATMTAMLSVSALAQQEVMPDVFETPPAPISAEQRSNKVANVKRTSNQQDAQKTKRNNRTASNAKADANQSAQGKAALVKVTY
ncbi:MAG TPA: hypothetical protein VK473_13715 [Terriglobales bacterium]|nr:hypothetical protein [Terriglobales bacterium]